VSFSCCKQFSQPTYFLPAFRGFADETGNAASARLGFAVSYTAERESVVSRGGRKTGASPAL